MVKDIPEEIESVRHSIYTHYPKSRVLELFPDTLSHDVCVTWLRRFSEFVYKKGLQGSVAECGVFRGFTKNINMFFPDRKCYLFDSFEGFCDSDINSDKERKPIDALLHKDLFFNEVKHSFKTTSVDSVMSKMRYPDNVIIKQGYVPQTLRGVEDKFCFVNLDMDLYNPMLEGLRFFYQRMVNDGIILLHDYYPNDYLLGVEAAVQDYEKEIGHYICKIPSECSSSLVVVKR